MNETNGQVKHSLTISEKAKPTCSCGEVFDAPITKAYRAWQNHLAIPKLFEEVSRNALVEREARLLTESTIRELLTKGISALKISEAIGKDDNGKALISTSTISRLANGQYKQTPRRRKKEEALEVADG